MGSTDGRRWERSPAAGGSSAAMPSAPAGHSYLRLRFSEGRQQLILDMSGLRDPNGYTPTILRAAVRRGQPLWSWSGSN